MADETMKKLDLADYSKMKELLTLQLLSSDGNGYKLDDVPYRKVEDMTLVYRFDLGDTENGRASILVTNDMLRRYGIDEEQLHQDAMASTVNNRPASLRTMGDVLSGVEMESTPLWVASVDGGMNGACVIQYPGFLDQAAKTLGGDFFVLPSSIHEVLLYQDDGTIGRKDLEEMVQSINESEVAPADRLSDFVYHYDSKERVFENARSFEARAEAREQAADNHMENPSAMTVLLVEPEKHPQVVEIGSDLKSLQSAIGGMIETVYPFEENVGLIVNEEGKLNGLPLNRALKDENGEVLDVLAGTFLVTGLSEEGFCSLTKDQTEKFQQEFYQPEAFVRMGNSIMAIPIPEERLKAAEKAKDQGRDAAARPKNRKPEIDGH
ncbi:MAG: DUF5688 family protein [Eubacterium sp.]